MRSYVEGLERRIGMLERGRKVERKEAGEERK